MTIMLPSIEIIFTAKIVHFFLFPYTKFDNVKPDLLFIVTETNYCRNQLQLEDCHLVARDAV